eukprot:388065-Pyramimonas_sp.AAC.1
MYRRCGAILRPHLIGPHLGGFQKRTSGQHEKHVESVHWCLSLCVSLGPSLLQCEDVVKDAEDEGGGGGGGGEGGGGGGPL